VKAAAILLVALLGVVPAVPRAQSCDLTAATRVWAKCSACHSLDAPKVGAVGPSLLGLFGRSAGKSPGFVFSPAFRAAKFAWNDATFDDFLTDPQRVVPGNVMAFSGLRNGDDRKAISCFIRQGSTSQSALQTR
jgi:cytochrome c2